MFDAKIKTLTFGEEGIDALVAGSEVYEVSIAVKDHRILYASCTCPYDKGGKCKHIALVLFEADKRMDWDTQGDEPPVEAVRPSGFSASSPNLEKPEEHRFVFENFQIGELSESMITHFSAVSAGEIQQRITCDVRKLEINSGVFHNTTGFWDSVYVEATLDPENKTLILECDCKKPKRRMCEHQSAWMHILLRNYDIRIFFDKKLRQAKCLRYAEKYGLEKESDLDQFFELQRDHAASRFVLKRKDLLPLDKDSLKQLSLQLLPEKVSLKESLAPQPNTQNGLVFSQSKYSSNFFIYYFEANTSKDGGIKNPLREKNPIQEMDHYDDVDSIKFFTAISLFKERYENSATTRDKLKALRTIAKNPLKLPFYYHNTKLSENITVQSTKPVKISLSEHLYMSFQVKASERFYEIMGYVHLNGKKVNLRMVRLRYEFIFMYEGQFFLVDNPYYLKLFKFFKEHQFKLTIHESGFEEFKTNFLDPIEDKVEINYAFIKPASNRQLVEKGFHSEIKRSIYLEESEDYILITPSVRYGEIEIPALSLKKINAFDSKGDWFSVERDHHLENNFVGLVMRQHPDFEEQLGQFDYFYLHRRVFLDSGWFIDAFEVWKNHEIEVLGFNRIKDNKLNFNKMKVSVTVSSGMDWFETSAKIKFGNEEVSLKQVQKAIKNASRFIQLDDGSQGMIPEDWIEKFSRYFRSGEVHGETIRTAKINFSVIDDLYEKEMLSGDVGEEISWLNSKIASFKTIHDVKVPKGLKADLRDYQKQGLNWLNFLDEFNFGGCLADDMGLGKTLQVIAFIQSQKEKTKGLTNLVVVPTSLLFNWQRECEKFAPKLTVLPVYGNSREKNPLVFAKYDIVLTSYGTLMSDITHLKDFRFHYIFLDESQAIKNPESQRYKTVRLLKAKNRIVLTGTPIENNTFDLYAQMSFVNPGLFLSQKRFKDEFSTPIDKFKDIRRAKELQQKINPFILRRTKKQVARELPEKTEMVIYCEMDAEQRKVYDSYKNEIREQFLKPVTADSPENKSMLILKGLTKLRQICDSPRILSDEADYGSSSAKMRVLLEEIESRSKHHKILVFSQFVSMLDLIREELDKLKISHEYLTGQTKDREEKVHSFQNDDEIRVFLISLKAGGTGLNLTEADYVFLVDPWWNPAVENQAIDRCYRIGQKKNVVAVRLITPGTIEEKIMLLQENKRELAEDIIKTDVNILKSLSQEDLLGLLS
ncbi:MAG: helicase [Crocinitomicaceae bacterium]|nr:helicase [Crocinitomicaceae bacterium]